MRLDKNSEITKNIKIIEWMKTELIISLGDLFNLLFKGTRPVDQILQDTLANIVMVTYLLSKRLGISFKESEIELYNFLKKQLSPSIYIKQLIKDKMESKEEKKDGKNIDFDF